MVQLIRTIIENEQHGEESSGGNIFSILFIMYYLFWTISAIYLLKTEKELTDYEYEGFVYKNGGNKQSVEIFLGNDMMKLEINTFYVIHVYKIDTNGAGGKWIIKPDLIFNVSESNLDKIDNSNDSDGDTEEDQKEVNSEEEDTPDSQDSPNSPDEVTQDSPDEITQDSPDSPEHVTPKKRLKHE